MESSFVLSNQNRQLEKLLAAMRRPGRRMALLDRFLPLKIEAICDEKTLKSAAIEI